MPVGAHICRGGTPGPAESHGFSCYPRWGHGVTLDPVDRDGSPGNREMAGAQRPGLRRAVTPRGAPPRGDPAGLAADGQCPPHRVGTSHLPPGQQPGPSGRPRGAGAGGPSILSLRFCSHRPERPACRSQEKPEGGSGGGRPAPLLLWSHIPRGSPTPTPSGSPLTPGGSPPELRLCARAGDPHPPRTMGLRRVGVGILPSLPHLHLPLMFHLRNSRI